MLPTFYAGFKVISSYSGLNKYRYKNIIDDIKIIKIYFYVSPLIVVLLHCQPIKKSTLTHQCFQDNSFRRIAYLSGDIYLDKVECIWFSPAGIFKCWTTIRHSILSAVFVRLKNNFYVEIRGLEKTFDLIISW